MKKKLFTLITLLVAIVTGASAATTWTFRAADIKNGADFAPTGTNVFVADDSKELTYKGNNGNDALVATAATIGGVSYSSYVNLNGTTSSGRYMYVEGISGTGTLSIVFASGKNNDKKITINDNAYNGTEITSINSTEANLNGTKQDIEITTSLNAGHKYYINGQRSVYAVIWTPSATPAKDYTVTAASNNNSYGTAATSASSLDEGETATITATPKTGYEFTSWAVSGEGSSLSSTTTNPTTLTMGTANATVTATFSAINYTITHNAATGGTYTISVAGGEATSENTTATIGQSITLAGTPTDPAHTYVVWNVKDANEADVTVTNNQFTMPASNVTIAPVFSEPLNTLFSMTNITGPEGDVASKETKSVTATFVKGGSAEIYNGKGSKQTMLVSNHLALNGSSDSYIHIILPNNVILKAGDVISAEGDNGSGESISWKLGKTSSASNKTCPYTLTGEDALIGATELYIKKNGGVQISSVTIQGSGTVSDFAITSSTTPEVAIDAESTITYTTSSTGDITFTSSDEGVARVSEAGVITGVGGGTATITITQDADATYRLGIAKITVTVPEIAMIKVKLNGTSDPTVTGSVDGVTAAKANIESGNKFGTGAYVTLTLPGGTTFQTGDVLVVNITTVSSGGGSIKVYDPANKDEDHVWYNTETIGVVGNNKFVLPAAINGKSSISICRTSSNGWNAKVAFIAVYRPDAMITLNANGYATYSAGTDFTYAGADAYTMALNLAGGTLTGTKLAADTKIPAGAGILFKGAAGDKVSIVNATGASALVNNNLHGTTAEGGSTVSVPGGKTIYVLSGKTFKPYTGTTFAANKAYFQVDGTTVESRTFNMSFDGETTGINAVENTNVEVNDGVFYNLNGQRVNTPRKGLYIVNGKKVMVK